MRLLLLGIIAIAATPAFADEQLERLAMLMDGTFVFDPGNQKADQGYFSDRRERIDAASIGQYVFYLQLNQGEERRLYRQRILVISRNEENGQIEQRTYRLKEAERFADGSAANGDFDGFSDQDIEPYFEVGCVQVWTETTDGYRGYVDPDRCRIISSRTGKPRLIEAENLLTADSLSLAERGFSPEREQLFGTPPGEFLGLTRQSQP